MVKLKHSLILIFAAVIWGTAFVWQTEGSAYLAPFAFNSLRFAVGALVLLPVILFRRATGKERSNVNIKRTVFAGILTGSILFAAAALQQAGLTFGVSPGKAGFITALYIVLVPIILLIAGKKPNAALWIGVCTAVAGLYLLCVRDDGFTLELADGLVLLCGLAYAFHIISIGHFSEDTDAVMLSAVQFASASVFSSAAMAFFERPELSDVIGAATPVFLTGAFSCGVAFTFQTIGQKGLDPTVASLIMSLESLFAVIAGWLLMGDVLSLREGAGCVLMTVAIVLAQLPSKSETNSKISE